MSNNAAGLVVAIVGVLGTLAAAVLTQLFAVRAQRDQRREESWRTTLRERRDSCIALNVEARRFEQTLSSFLMENRESMNADLESAWQALVSCYSEGRITLPDSVVRAAANAFGELRSAYGTILEASSPTGSNAMEPATREELRHRLDDGSVMDAIRRLREASRDALGSDLPLRPPKGL